jgi:hypothetical protein
MPRIKKQPTRAHTTIAIAFTDGPNSPDIIRKLYQFYMHFDKPPTP